MAVLAPIMWLVSLVLSYVTGSATFASSNIPAILDLKNEAHALELFLGLNLLALLGGAMAQALPGRFLIFPNKRYWLATPERQEHYFQIGRASIFAMMACLNFAAVQLLEFLKGSAGKPIWAIGFLCLLLAAVYCLLLWPTKNLRIPLENKKAIKGPFVRRDFGSHAQQPKQVR